MKLQLAIIAFLLIFSGCKCSVKETLHDTGEKAGELVGETAEGVKTGLENAFDIKIEVSDSLQKRGIQLGKLKLGDAGKGTDNLLSVYIIFNYDFNGIITTKVFDNKGLDMGRSQLQLSGKKNEAHFADFNFDDRTNIDRDSKIVME